MFGYTFSQMRNTVSRGIQHVAESSASKGMMFYPILPFSLPSSLPSSLPPPLPSSYLLFLSCTTLLGVHSPDRIHQRNPTTQAMRCGNAKATVAAIVRRRESDFVPPHAIGSVGVVDTYGACISRALWAGIV